MDVSHFAYLEPFDCHALTKVRLGKQGDGGYTIPSELIQDSSAMVSFGINDEDSFEYDFYRALNGRTIPMYLSDPFAPYSRDRPMFVFEAIGLGPATEPPMTSLGDFFKRHSLPSRNVFVKIDIERTEWDSFLNIDPSIFEQIHCLTIELHDLLDGTDKSKIIKVLQMFHSLFYLYHIHVNNNGLIAKYASTEDRAGYLVDVAECTFISKKYAQEKGLQFVKRMDAYPEAIDQTNMAGKFDPPIKWWNLN